jgi:hypothetical protein
MQFSSAAADAGATFFKLAEAAGVATPEARQVIGQMLLNSRILERFDEQLKVGESPSTALLRGSGVVDWICRQTVTAWEAVLVMIITIVVTFVIAFIISFIPGGVAVVIVLVVLIEVLISWLVVLVAVAVAVTIVYGVAKAIEGLWNWLTAPATPPPPAPVPVPGG